MLTSVWRLKVTRWVAFTFLLLIILFYRLYISVTRKPSLFLFMEFVSICIQIPEGITYNRIQMDQETSDADH